jgi:hypothetical protein
MHPNSVETRRNSIENGRENEKAASKTKELATDVVGRDISK